MSSHLVILLALVALPITSTVEAGPRARAKGKVIRVERSRGSTATPRVCDVRGDKTGTCLGSEPVIGELVSVLDESGVLAEVKIVEAIAFTTGGSSSCTSLWNVKLELVKGDLSSIPLRTIGVVDPEVHPSRGRMLPKDQFPASPSGRADDQVVIVIDRDGDRSPDIIVTQNTCDTSSSAIPGGSCIDEWARVGGRMARVQQTNFAACGF